MRYEKFSVGVYNSIRIINTIGVVAGGAGGGEKIAAFFMFEKRHFITDGGERRKFQKCSKILVIV